LVAEHDRAVGQQAEQIGRARVDAGVERAVAADLAVHHDVRLRVGREPHGGQLLLERRAHHPYARPPAHRSRTSRHAGTPARRSSRRARRSSLGRGSPREASTRSARPVITPGYTCCTCSDITNAGPRRTKLSRRPRPWALSPTAPTRPDAAASAAVSPAAAPDAIA